MGKYSIQSLKEKREDLIGKHKCKLCNKEATHYIKVTPSISEILKSNVIDRLTCSDCSEELLKQIKQEYRKCKLDVPVSKYNDDDDRGKEWYNNTRNIRGF